MEKKRKKRHTLKFKAMIAKEAIIKEGTKEGNVIILAQKYGISPSQITEWRQIAKNGIEGALKDKRKIENKKEHEDSMKMIGHLYAKVSKLQDENDFLVKLSKQYCP